MGHAPMEQRECPAPASRGPGAARRADYGTALCIQIRSLPCQVACVPHSAAWDHSRCCAFTERLVATTHDNRCRRLVVTPLSSSTPASQHGGTSAMRRTHMRRCSRSSRARLRRPWLPSLRQMGGHQASPTLRDKRRRVQGA